MNPLLLKPERDTASQVILLGQVNEELTRQPWRGRSAKVWPQLAGALDALRAQGMRQALAILDKLRERDRKARKIAPARRVAGQKMTPELARRIRELHEGTRMTQQEIAFELGVNQGRVNEVIKRGKWLDDDPHASEAVARDRAMARIRGERPRAAPKPRPAASPAAKAAKPQLSLF